MTTGGGGMVEATGVIEFPTYHLIRQWELHHPPAEVLRDNPVQHVDYLGIRGASDETLAALASHPDLTGDPDAR